MTYRALRFGKLCFAWGGDVSGVLDLTKRHATFYGIAWRWMSFGFYLISAPTKEQP